MRRPSNLLADRPASSPPSQPAPDPSRGSYVDLYGLSQPPFGSKRTPSGYILLNAHRRVFEMLVEHALHGAGPVLLTGEDGSGKTEMLKAVAAVAEGSDIQVTRLFRSGSHKLSEAECERALNTRVDPPRRHILVVDDFDLLPQPSLDALVRLFDSDTPAMLLSASAGHNRQDIAAFSARMRNSLRLIPITPAEARQFIERSLWMAGGTTRRLMEAEAIRIIIARANGNPGAICRMMEATLTAGFARGDAMISPRTVQAAIGAAPVPARHAPARPRPAGVGRWAIQILSFALFLAGAGLFAYRAMLGEPAAPPAPSPATAPATAPASSSQQTARPSTPISPGGSPPVPARPNPQIAPDLMAALMKRGDESLSQGDVAAARLYFQRAADGGNDVAALALGKTYDPAFAGTRGGADVQKAATWYRRAVMLGNSSAAELLQHLPP